MAKSFEHETVAGEKPLSADEREELIQDLISTQRLAGVEVSYDEAVTVIDKVYSEPFPRLDGI